MEHVSVQGATLPEAYHEALLALHKRGAVTECPAYNTRQKEVSMTVHVVSPLAEPRISKLIIGGFHELEQYRQEILDGILNFRIGSGWDYTYNSRIMEFPLANGKKFNQVDFVVTELRRDPYSRRAVICVRDNNADPFTTDPACLQHLQFFLRPGTNPAEKRLDCLVLFRSNDLPEAFFFNAFAFICLQEKIAGLLGVPAGTYTHTSNSMHAYEKNFKLLEDYCKKIEDSGGDIGKITYQYEGYFKDMMEEEKPSIEEFVKNLRSSAGK
jgi:thymidylate synthase